MESLLREAEVLFDANKRKKQIEQIAQCLEIKETLKKRFDNEISRIDARIEDINNGNFVPEGERY